VFPWLDAYAVPAIEHFGDSLLLLAHFYMGGEIVKLVERYGGKVADSYALALQAVRNPEKKVIVESAVHFMAETIATLANDDQAVWITNPKAGCTMEMLAKDHMVLPIAEELIERYGDELAVVAYMNTGGRIKGLAGRTGGAVCTSSNAHLVVDWVLKQGKKVFFVPDHHLGRNTGAKLGLDPARIAALPDPQIWRTHMTITDKRIAGGLAALDRAQMILWGSYCGVHTIFKPAMVSWWKERGWRVLVHPESPLSVVEAADGSGSTDYLWKAVMSAPRGSRIVIGTEGHFVRNAREQAQARGVEVMHLADIPDPAFQGGGCGCATMSRNDPPHLAGMLDLLRKGKPPDINRVLAGDVVDELSARRERLDESERRELVRHARLALERMIEITEGAARD
jgi:quinolinate synthase